MSNQLITINGSSLPVREFEGIRVVTFKDIAKVHKVPLETVRKNFYRNKKHFIKGIDYDMINSQNDGVTICPTQKRVTNLNVFTESGYLMLVKSLTDDTAWAVQRELVNNYFNQRGKKALSSSDDFLSFLVRLYPLIQEEYKKIIYYRLERNLTQEETAAILGHLGHQGLLSGKIPQTIRYQIPALSSQLSEIQPRHHNGDIKGGGIIMIDQLQSISDRIQELERAYQEYQILLISIQDISIPHLGSVMGFLNTELQNIIVLIDNIMRTAE